MKEALSSFGDMLLNSDPRPVRRGGGASGIRGPNIAPNEAW
jgi:hypothetical protein